MSDELLGINGDGTAESPYAPETWEELMLVSNISSGTYVRWEGGNLDFNDIMPEGFAENIRFRGNFDFQDAAFKNFYSTASSYAVQTGEASSSYSAINNLKLIDFYYNSTTSSTANFIDSGRCYFNNCYFSGYITNYRAVRFAYKSSGGANVGYGIFRQCSFNVEIVSDYETFHITSANSVFGGGDVRFYDSNIKFNIKAKTSVFHAVDMQNCLVQGSVTGLSAEASVNWGNNVFLIEADAPMTITGQTKTSAACQGISGENIVTCTDEQLRNAEYLRENGFPVALGG